MPPARPGSRSVVEASAGTRTRLQGAGGRLMGGDRGREDMDEGAMEFSLDELREFLEGDQLDVRADPEFKERLRRKLWEIVRARNPGGTDGSG